MGELLTPDEITPRWLTERLREAGHDGVEVKDFSSTAIGTGQLGKCIRFTLDIEGGNPETPRSLVGKFPSDDPTSRQTGVMLLVQQTERGDEMFTMLVKRHSGHAIDLGSDEYF